MQLVAVLLLVACLLSPGGLAPVAAAQYWSVHVRSGGIDKAREVASKHGLQLLGLGQVRE